MVLMGAIFLMGTGAVGLACAGWAFDQFYASRRCCKFSEIGC
jgi:hypothetical protein